MNSTDTPGFATHLVGCHHRISHAVLVNWLMRNQKFEREG